MSKNTVSPNASRPVQIAVPALILACSDTNDLYAVLRRAPGYEPLRCDSAAEAVAQAPDGGTVAILAEGYPKTPTSLPADLLAVADGKNLRLFVEYPANLPDLVVGPPQQDKLLRGVVTSDVFGADLAPMRIVTLNACHYVPVNAGAAHMVLARVAGMDTAVFGLANTPTMPLLFEHPRGQLLVATSRLSNFVTARHMPAAAWHIIWRMIFRWLNPGLAALDLCWTATVRPSFGRNELLPADCEAQALRRSADWLIASRMLRHPDWPKDALDQSHASMVVFEKLGADWPSGDGSLGVLEGFCTFINEDGSQAALYPVRTDCACETAMLMAFDAAANRRDRHGRITANLLDYVCRNSDLAVGSRRLDPDDPRYGLLAWKLGRQAEYWGDDNARAMLGMIAAAALRHESRWDEVLARGLLANLRTTGPNGHRPHCVKAADLMKHGWLHYWRLDNPENTPHMTAWLWPCFLWAYRKTGFEPFLTRSEAGFRILLAAYPQWDYVNGSGSLEMARALLPLAWLVRAHDTPEHRQWLHRVAGDLIALQDASGAIRETIAIGRGAYRNCIAKSNAEFGTCETNLIQADGDPVCDCLYTCNFALIGLHEAAAATGKTLYARAEAKLAEFLCRIQLRSERHPELNGAWYRAFNFGRWDHWACNSDGKWGPWCIETGWTQPWIGATLALRRMQTSLWDVAMTHDLDGHFDAIRQQMLPNEILNRIFPTP